jgi:hypothetical protein
VALETSCVAQGSSSVAGKSYPAHSGLSIWVEVRALSFRLEDYRIPRDSLPPLGIYHAEPSFLTERYSYFVFIDQEPFGIAYPKQNKTPPATPVRYTTTRSFIAPQQYLE